MGQVTSNVVLFANPLSKRISVAVRIVQPAAAGAAASAAAAAAAAFSLLLPNADDVSLPPGKDLSIPFLFRWCLLPMAV